MARRQRRAAISSAIMMLITSTFMLYLALVAGAALSTGLALAGVMMLFSLFLSVVSYSIMEMKQRQAFTGKKMAAASRDAEQKRTIEIDLPFEQAYTLALEALQTLDEQKIPLPDHIIAKRFPRTQSLRVHENNQEMGQIRAGLRINFLGIKDPLEFSHINIHLQRLDAHSTRLQIKSSAVSFVDDFDMGKNLHYVNELSRFIRRESQQYSAAARLSDESSDTVSDTSFDSDAAAQQKHNQS